MSTRGAPDALSERTHEQYARILIGAIALDARRYPTPASEGGRRATQPVACS
jgi:hypothetical protein